MLSSGAFNFRLGLSNTTTFRVAAGAGNNQVGIVINGLFRYITSDVTQVHPGGSAGTYDIFVVASANSFAAGDVDNTDYSFGLRILAPSNTPTGNHNGRAIVEYAKIGECQWDGAAVTELRQLRGAGDTSLPLNPTAPSTSTAPIVVRDASSRNRLRVAADGTLGFSASGGVVDTELGRAGVSLLSTPDSLSVGGTIDVGDDITTDGDVSALGGAHSLSEKVDDSDARLTNQRTPTDSSVTWAKTGRGDAGLGRGAFRASLYSSPNGYIDYSVSTTHRVIFSREYVDVSAAYNNATGVWVVPETGYYFVHMILWVMSLGGEFGAAGQINFNNTRQVLASGNMVTSGGKAYSVTTIESLRVGDQVWVEWGASANARLYAEGGTFGPTYSYSHFCGHLIGRA